MVIIIIINHVKKLRNKFGISQYALAKIIGVTRTTIANIEGNKFDPNLKTAYKIAALFNLGIEDVFIFIDEKQEVPYQLSIDDLLTYENETV